MLGLAQVDPSEPYAGLYEIGWTLEFPVLLVSALLTFRGLYRAAPLGLHRLFAHQPNPGIGVARASMLFAGFWFWFVLQTGAASDIVGYYTLLYVLLAFAVLLYAGFRFPVAGVYYPADVLERGNLAAALTLSGFALGTAFAFGGALTGEGPGWWVVVVFFFLAYWELRGNVALVARIGNLDEEMRLDRDASAGALLGAVALASGLVSGRAAAGDFTGWERDLPDYARRLWPLLVVALAGALAGAWSRFSPKKAHVRVGASAALVLGGFLYYFLT